jgi:hypothetical protein
MFVLNARIEIFERDFGYYENTNSIVQSPSSEDDNCSVAEKNPPPVMVTEDYSQF